MRKVSFSLTVDAVVRDKYRVAATGEVSRATLFSDRFASIEAETKRKKYLGSAEIADIIDRTARTSGKFYDSVKLVPKVQDSAMLVPNRWRGTTSSSASAS